MISRDWKHFTKLGGKVRSGTLKDLNHFIGSKVTATVLDLAILAKWCSCISSVGKKGQ